MQSCFMHWKKAKYLVNVFVSFLYEYVFILQKYCD